MAYEFVDLPAPTGDNPGGLRQLLTYAPLVDFDTLAVPAGAAGSGNADRVAITGNHTFKTGKRFFDIHLEINKNQFQGEIQGAIRGGHHKFTHSSFVPGLSPSQVGLLELIKGIPLVILVPLANGQWVQMGEKDNGAHLSYNIQTGTDEGGELGCAVTIISYGKMRFYQGSISRTPAP